MEFKVYKKMGLARINTMVELAKGGKKGLNLGDVNSSYLTKKCPGTTTPYKGKPSRSAIER